MSYLSLKMPTERLTCKELRNRVLECKNIHMVRLPHSMSFDQEEVAIDYSIRNEMREHASRIAYVCAYHAVASIAFMTAALRHVASKQPCMIFDYPA